MPNPKMNFLPPEEQSKMQETLNTTGEGEGQRTSNQLTQADIDRYIELQKAYSGVMVPLEIQLDAWEKHGEPPSGITLDQSIVGDMSVIDYLKEVLELRRRKNKYGVVKGVVDPDAIIDEKQRAVVIYTRCALEIAEAEVMEEKSTRRVFFPAANGATVGRKGHMHLFPGYPDSPTGPFRGDGASYNVQECIEFVQKHFPEVEDEFLNALALDEENDS